MICAQSNRLCEMLIKVSVSDMEEWREKNF